mgnify:CR=1 FL=1
MTGDTATTKGTTPLVYRHSWHFRAACRQCQGRDHRHAGYVGRGRVRIWRCLNCGRTEKVAAEFADIIDDNGVGHLQPI